jgi:hypothetical protein
LRVYESAAQWRWAALVGAVLALSPKLAAAAPIELDWDAPPQCPQASAVIDRVEVRVDAHPVTARGVVVESDGAWSLTLDIEGVGGSDRRVLEGESCVALVDAAALLIRVATGPDVDSTGAVAEAEVVAEPDPPPTAEPEPTEEAPVAETTPPPTEASLDERETEPPDARLGVHARAGGLVEFGTLLPETVAGGVAVAAGINVPWVRVEARGHYVAPRRLDDAQNPGVGVRIDGWGVGASGCGVWEGQRVFVPGCLGAQLGRTRARAFGLEQSGVGRGLWGHLLADVAVGVRVHSHVALTLAAQGVLALRRPRFRVRGFPPLFQTGVGAARLALGVEFALRRRG